MAEQEKGIGKQDEGNPDDANPEFENFQQLLKRVFSVPKEKIDEQRAEYEREKERKRAG